MWTRLLSTVLVAAALLAPLGCGDDDDGSGQVDTIVVISVDTLRHDHVGAYAPPGGQVFAETPAMDALAAAGLRFANAWAPVPLTLPSHVTMFSGLPPTRTGVRLNTFGRLAPRAERPYPLLAEALAEAGWHTAAFVSADALSARYGLDQGFERYDDAMPADAARPSVQLAERPGADTVRAALAHVRQVPSDARLFLFVHLFEPHAPYAADGTYAGDVAVADALVGRLRRGLADRGRDRRTAWVLVSDHGEALHTLGELTHGFLLNDAVLHVPLVLVAPGIEAGVRGDPALVADVAPTLAALTGVPWSTAEGPGTGRDLLGGLSPPSRPRVAESLYGEHLHRWAQLVSATGPEGTLVDAGRDRLHWLPTRPWGSPPREQTALVPDTDAVRALSRHIVEYRKAERPERMAGGPVAGGYGGGGRVTPFLPPAENARLPDPHLGLHAHHRLDALKAIVVNPRMPPRALEKALRSLDALDGSGPLEGSPELSFWRGEVRVRLLEHEPPALARQRAAEAETAFLEAFHRGRTDTQTLVRACGVNAGGRERACLERLDRLLPQVPQPGPDVARLRARLEAQVQDR